MRIWASDRASSLLAIAGDTLVLVGFATAGRASHHEVRGNPAVEAVSVALPFLAGWFIVAPWFGSFRPALIRDRRAVLPRVAVAWLIGGSLGLVFRAAFQQRAVPPSFDAIALGFNLVTLTAWRLLLATATR